MIGTHDELIREKNLNSLFIEIAFGLPYQRDRLSCLYSYWLLKKGYQNDYKIYASYEQVLNIIADKFKDLNDNEIDNIFKLINIDELQTILNMFNNNDSSIQYHLSHRARPIEDDGLGGSDDSYCPKCMQSPCMCSDPF